MVSEAGMQPLLDGKVAEESSEDHRWVKFEQGHHEIVVDLQKKTPVKSVMVRTLNYNPEGINTPLKVYVYASEDGKNYSLASVKDAPYFPNNKYDAWIDGILFDKLNENARYLKVAFDAPQKVYMDEFFINPAIK